jgi:hypothetical protein
LTVRSLTAEAVGDLRDVALRFGDERRARKSAALARCTACAITDARALVAYHDCLLCLLAYPETRSLREAARAELERVAQAARRLNATSARARRQLSNSGIAFTRTTVNFGWDIARWLAQRFPRCAEIDSFGEHGAALPTILAEALAPMEFELAGFDGSASEFLEHASSERRGSRLEWLVAAFLRLPCSDALRDVLFESLQPFIVIEPGNTMLSRTFVRGLPQRAFFHRDPLVRSVDLAKLLDEPLAPVRTLHAREQAALIDAARAMLASLGRETDAIAAACADGVAWHELPRGVAIALYTMRAERRSPLDSHVGMMLFKNRIPVGYGGGWPLLGSCRIGVNIFAAFRGGESAFLFAQVLRVYRQRFAVGRFVAEPSQFGGADKEGLSSGAFWFYYRLGFRPIDPECARLAAAEWMRMQRKHGHRTSIAILRQLARSDIELRLEPVPDCEPRALSEAVTRWIDARFGGDRRAAERAAVRLLDGALGDAARARWTDDERRARAALAPLLAQIPQIAQWPASDRRALAALIRAKADDEFRFHERLRGHRRLRDALTQLARRGGR